VCVFLYVCVCVCVAHDTLATLFQFAANMCESCMRVCVCVYVCVYTCVWIVILWLLHSFKLPKMSVNLAPVCACVCMFVCMRACVCVDRNTVAIARSICRR